MKKVALDIYPLDPSDKLRNEGVGQSKIKK
jgi:hypothetical protein